MSYVQLVCGSNSLKFKGLIHPSKDELDLGFASATSEGGEEYFSRKSAPTLTLVRAFADVRDKDFAALRNWYINVAQDSQNPFSFYDCDGSAYLVRWINGLVDWQKNAKNQWSGLIKLRVENFEP